ncbi:hypothetical protein AB0A60_33565 [Streptomyces sp. NPDC046275]|uniref:hypothetical protein n=1 Tax=Streptomyces sp. NPDC046275 TaxID=3157201 RepID=UPI0033EE7E8D
MGYITYGHTELDTYLRTHAMSRAGTLCNLKDMHTHVRELAPLWWEHTGATLGALRFTGGFMGNALSDLFDDDELFTSCAVTGIEQLRAGLAPDRARRALYEDDHADRLLLNFQFGTFHIADAADSCRFFDGSRRPVAAHTTVAMLDIDRSPSWVHPGGFGAGDLHGAETRITTVLTPLDQKTAVLNGWRAAIDAR